MLNQSFDYNQLVNTPLLAYLINATNILTYIFVRWTTESDDQISAITRKRPTSQYALLLLQVNCCGSVAKFHAYVFSSKLNPYIVRIHHDINRSICLSIMVKLTFQIPSLMVKACLCVKFRIDVSTWIRRFQIDDFQDYIKFGQYYTANGIYTIYSTIYINHIIPS